MIKYIIKRLLQLIPILVGITFLSFAMMRLAGGDAVTYMYENAGSAVSQEVSAMGTVKEIAPVTSSNPSIETVESNVPTFINTWQTWLKIERQEPKIEEKIALPPVVEKNTIIEKFIEKEPRISKLKEDSEFVAKERGTNISHLMTETLAQLYVEQKLYAKAIKAYEILTKKHPQKEELFNEKIQAIKESRKNP